MLPDTGWRPVVLLLLLAALATVAQMLEFSNDEQQRAVFHAQDNQRLLPDPHSRQSERKRRSTANRSHNRRVNSDDHATSTIVDNDGCSNLIGSWVNQQGSRFVIQTVSGGSHLRGLYKSAVEQVAGSAGSNHSHAIGVISGRLITFSVAWAGGRSVTAWSGQCFQVCNDKLQETTLHTTWTLTTLVDSCQNKWSQTHIGQDVFVRESLSNQIQDVQLLGNDVPESRQVS